MKKVLFINHTNDIFGAETVLLQIIERCFLGFEQNVYVLEPRYKKKSSFKKHVKKIGCNNVISLPYKNLGVNIIRSCLVILYNLYALLLLYFYVKKNEIEIIYSNTSTTCIGLMLAHLTRKPHIWHIHEATGTNGLTPSLAKLYEILFSYKRNQTLFVSQKQYNKWKDQINSLNNAMVVYNPIKEYSKSVMSIEKTTFGYLGSRDKNKNIPLLINAFADVHKKDDNTFLLLSESIGDANEIVKERIIHFQLENLVVEKLITDANAEDFYKIIDVLVLPSLSETWGLVILEAICAGKATIVTQNSGLTELLEDGIHTLFVDPESEQSIVDAMIKMTNKKFREQIAKNAKNLIEEKNLNDSFKQQMQSLFL